MTSPRLASIPILGALLLAGCASAGSNRGAAEDKEASLLTRYVLSQCLARAYPDTDIARDAQAAAGGYMEFGSFPIEAYEEAAALAAEAASRTYQSKPGHPLHAMKCLDLLDGPELDRLIKRNVAPVPAGVSRPANTRTKRPAAAPGQAPARR